MSSSDLLNAVLQLPPEDRQELVYPAWKSLDADGQSVSEIEVLDSTAFADEIERRLDEAVVLGLGLTGFSLARYLAAQGAMVRVADTRAAPPFAERNTKLCKPCLGRLIVINQKRHMIITPRTLFGRRQGIGHHHQMQFVFTQVIPHAIKIKVVILFFVRFTC